MDFEKVFLQPAFAGVADIIRQTRVSDMAWLSRFGNRRTQPAWKPALLTSALRWSICILARLGELVVLISRRLGLFSVPVHATTGDAHREHTTDESGMVSLIGQHHLGHVVVQRRSDNLIAEWNLFVFSGWHEKRNGFCVAADKFEGS